MPERYELHPRRLIGRDAAVVAVLGVAIFVRLAYLFGATDANEAHSDATHYHEIATNLAAGRGFVSTFPQLALHDTAFRPPGYPFVLSLLYRVTGPSIVAGKLLGVVIGAVVVLLTYRLARNLGGHTAGLVAAGVVALSPPLIANDVNLLSEPMSLAFMLAAASAIQNRRWWLLGAWLGVLVLTRPSAQFALVAVVVWMTARFGMKRALVVAAVAVAVVAPWYVRNLATVGTPSLYTSNGFNLAANYSDPARATGHFVDPVFDQRFEAQRWDQFDEALWDRNLRATGLRGMQEHPEYVATNIVRNLAGTFELRPAWNEPPERADGRNLTIRAVGLPLFYVVTVVGAIGIWRARREATGAVVFLVVMVLSNLAITSLFLAPPRLRAPLDLVSAIGVGLVVASRMERRSHPPERGDSEHLMASNGDRRGRRQRVSGSAGQRVSGAGQRVSGSAGQRGSGAAGHAVSVRRAASRCWWRTPSHRSS